jgi:pyruvate formate lyase activating enzyme
MKGIIFNIMRYSVNDGPGIRTTVFLKGCPLRCKWCHNPESINRHKEIMIREDRCLRCGDCFGICQHGAVRLGDGGFVTVRELCVQCGRCVEMCCAAAREIVGKEVTTDEVMEEVLKDVVFFDQSGGGVSFSGGEPLLQHGFLLSLLQACKQQGIHTTVDTSGYTATSILDRVVPFVDLFLYDVKLMDDEKHQAWTGVSNQPILKNLRRLAGGQASVIVRIPLIPGVNDDDENIRQTGDFVASLRTINEVDVLPYHRIALKKYHHLGLEYAMADAVAPSPERLNHIVGELRKYVEHVVVGG